MNLHTIMTSMAPMVAFRESLFSIWEGDCALSVQEQVFTYSLKHPSSECISIDISALLQVLFDDNLMPKDKDIYDQLCTALVMHGNLESCFQYDEIAYDNKESFFEKCTCDDLMAYAVILLTEYIASIHMQSIEGHMVLHPNFKGSTFYTHNLTSILDDYSHDDMEIYPASITIISRDAEKTLEELSIIKNALTIIKVDNMAVSNKTLTNLVCDDIQRISKDVVHYYNGTILDTSSFKDCELEIGRFLYHITRDATELNSTANIKAIFESLKGMVSNVSKASLNMLFNRFLYANQDKSALMIAYFKRLAALNNEAYKGKENLASVTFNYDDRELFTIFSEKAA